MSSPHSRPTLHAADPYPELASVFAAARSRVWHDLFAAVSTLDPAQQYTALRMVEGMIDDDGVTEILALAKGSFVLPRLVAGAALIELGWNVRTGHRASNVSREQFDTFHSYLRRAEQQLIEVTAYEPERAAGWSLRLLTCRGLELGKNEARRRYTQAVKAQPHYVMAQIQLLQQLCPKWSGSWDEMHAFARECAFSAPEGYVNGAIVVDGHMERWLELGEKAGLAYLRQPAVQHEVTQAAAHSVLHPSFRLVPGWVWAHNAFACYWSLIGNHQAAALHFRVLGNFAHEFPWAYLGDSANIFDRHRSLAMSKG